MKLFPKVNVEVKSICADSNFDGKLQPYDCVALGLDNILFNIEEIDDKSTFRKLFVICKTDEAIVEEEEIDDDSVVTFVRGKQKHLYCYEVENIDDFERQ